MTVSPMFMVSKKLAWDKVGEKTFQTGIDRGVLYLNDGRAVAWNGLISVEEVTTAEIKPYYLDGVKYMNNVIPGDFQGKLKAFTYPEEFNEVNGIAVVSPGLFYHDQPVKSFGLSYRTGRGNDTKGLDLGYEIHILYNLVAIPDSVGFDTLTQDSQIKPYEFSWTLTGRPVKLEKNRPTVHISILSTETDPGILQVIEDILYGTDVSLPRLPTITEIAHFFGYFGALIIVDNGDGTWTAIDESDTYITMLSETEFQIAGANATFLDATTYEISDTAGS